MGQAKNSKLLLVVHTYLEISANEAHVRIISARPATKHEQRQYEAVRIPAKMNSDSGRT